MTKRATKIKALYDAIPAFACKPGCTDCCGVVPFSREEWASVPADAPRAEAGLDCQFSGVDHCAIYAHRPFMCRLFGAVADARLRCPHGCAPEQPLTARQGATLTARYRKLMGKPAEWSVQVSALDALRDLV